jgi:hypothetical protein
VQRNPGVPPLLGSKKHAPAAELKASEQQFDFKLEESNEAAQFGELQNGGNLMFDPAGAMVSARHSKLRY